MNRDASGFRNYSAPLFSTALLTLSSICLFSAANASALTPQGKGGTIKAVPTPAPAAKKTTQPKRSAPTGRTTRATSPGTGNSDAAEIAFWNSIKDSSNPEDFKAYLQEYPQGKFVTLAKNRLSAMESAAKEEAARKEEEMRRAEEAKREETRRKEEAAKAEAEAKVRAREIELRASVRAAPQNASTHGDLASFLKEQQKWAEAEAEFREARRVANYGVDHLLDELVEVLEKQNKLSQAETELRAYVTSKPDHYRSHDRLGRFF